MAKFLLQPLVNSMEVITVRLGAGTGTANYFNDNDKQKFIKWVADSRYDLCAIGDEIEGWVSSVDVAPSDQYSTGGRAQGGLIAVALEGLQASGTGTLPLGSWLVAGTPIARNTAMPLGAPNVRAATDQSITGIARIGVNACRLLSWGKAGTGAVGTIGVAEHYAD